MDLPTNQSSRFVRLPKKITLPLRNIFSFRFLLENLDVNRFGTTYTLMNAMDGGQIVSSTNLLGDFYTLWNNTVHQAQTPGVSLPNILASVRNHTTVIMNDERTNSAVGGQSMIMLLIANTAGVNEADSNFAFEQILLLREQVPDMTLLYLAGGTASRFNRFARTPSTDVFQLTIGGVQPITTSVNPVIQRIQRGLYAQFYNLRIDHDGDLCQTVST